MESNKKAIGYARTSTDDQSLSIEAQTEQIKKYCERNDIELIGMYTAQGVSGGMALDGRTTLLEAIDAVAGGGAHYLITTKRDRLARDIMVSAMIERLVQRHNGTIMTCDGVTTEDTPEGRMFRQMLDVFAEYERQMIKSRTRAALRQKKARGEKLGGKNPYGYYAREGKLVKNPAEQAVIKEIKELKQRMSYTQLERYLARKGYTNKGNPFSRTTIARLCRRSEA